MPDRNVTSLAQTPDGYLWCGTYSGLARYDGEHFKVFGPANTPPLNEVQIQALHCDSEGRLWIGGSMGELVVHEDGRFRRVVEADGLPPHQAGLMNSMADGDFWVKGRSDGLYYRYRNGRFESVSSGERDFDVAGFVAGSDGLEWAVEAADRAMIRWTSAGAQLQSPIAPEGEPEKTLGGFFRLQSGELAVTSSHGIYAWQGLEWQLQTKFVSAVESQALEGVEDWEGNFWVTFAGVGLVCRQPIGGRKSVALPELAERPFLQALLLDADGNIWVSGSDGLYRIRRQVFRAQPDLAEVRNLAANAIIEDSCGTMWLLYRKGITRVRSGRWEYAPNPVAEADLCTGAPSQDGGVFLGYANHDTAEQYVEKVTADGSIQRLGQVPGYPRVILERRDGEVWVGTDMGLWRLQAGGCKRVPIPGEARDHKVLAMSEDRDGRMWVGAYGCGLFRQDKDGSWHRLTTTNDPGGDLIVALHRDNAGTLWAATDRGLARWKNGSWHAFSDMDGALPGCVRSVTSDRQGGLWLTSPFGVSRAERSELNALADGRDTLLSGSRFDRSDGLPSVSCPGNQPAMLRSEDGRIWVATATGIAVADPANWTRRRSRLGAPPVHVDVLLADDKPLFRTDARPRRIGSDAIVVPPGTHRLEFRYSAVNLSANRKSRFRYRLEGSDQEWVESGDARSVVLHSLSPGKYRFQVIAANNFGLWNRTGDAVPFTVEPHWWQTLWARIGAGVFALGLVGISRSVQLRRLHRERLRREEFSRRLIQSQEAERKRIAGELHDSLGQNLLVAKNQLYLAQEMTAGADARIQPKLQQVAESVEAALQEARMISRQLRPFQLERLGLTKAISAMIRQTSESTRLPIQLRIESVDALLPAESEVMVYRILQEALSNVVKHADASQVRIAVERRKQHIRMTVADDGRGFPADSLINGEDSSRGLGLTGFEERTRLLGGRFHCRTAPGQGTTLIFEIPLPGKENGEAKD